MGYIIHYYHYLFQCSKYPIFDQLGPIQAGSFVLLTWPQPSLITTSLAGKIRCFGFIMYFPSPISPKSPGSFMWQMVVPSQDLGTKYIHCYYSVIAPSPSHSQVTYLHTYKYILYTHTHTHTHTQYHLFLLPYQSIHPSNYSKNCIPDFPGGAVVKNLPANAGDMGSIPGPGRSHMPRNN